MLHTALLGNYRGEGGGAWTENPTCKKFVLVFMATKAAVPPTAAVSNETADAANAGMPKAHQPKQMHKQACEEPPAHNRTHEAHAHINAGTARAQHEHEATQQHRTTAQQKRTIHMTAPHDAQQKRASAQHDSTHNSTKRHDGKHTTAPHKTTARNETRAPHDTTARNDTAARNDSTTRRQQKRTTAPHKTTARNETTTP